MPFGKKVYKYHIVKEEMQPFGHMLYLIRYTAKNGAKSEQWIGVNKLRRFYEQDKLIGDLSANVMKIVTAKPEKPKGMNKGKLKLHPKTTEEGPVYSKAKVEPVSNWVAETKVAPKKWSIPDEVKINNIAIKSYCYSDPNGRWHVIMCDGIEDEDTYPDQEWAQRMVDMYNNPSEEVEKWD